MKKHLRIPLFLIIAIMILALCGCSQYAQPSNNVGGVDWSPSGKPHHYTLYPQTLELSYDGITYTYSVSRSDDVITYTVYYPNGGCYYETRGSYADNSGWNDVYRPDSYIDGEKLVDLLSRYYYTYTPTPNIANVIGALLFIGLGAFGAVFPEAAWHLEHIFKSWQYESVEPSSAGITWTRIGGILCIIMGIILFFSKWS